MFVIFHKHQFLTRSIATKKASRTTPKSPKSALSQALKNNSKLKKQKAKIPIFLALALLQLYFLSS